MEDDNTALEGGGSSPVQLLMARLPKRKRPTSLHTAEVASQVHSQKKKAGETKNIFWETNQDAVWPADRGEGGEVRVLKGGPSAAVLRCYGPGLLGWSTECPPSFTQLAISRRGPTRVHRPAHGFDMFFSPVVRLWCSSESQAIVLTATDAT